MSISLVLYEVCPYTKEQPKNTGDFQGPVVQN